MKNIEFSQELVDQFLYGWNGISTYNTEDYNIGPSVLGMYYPNYESAAKAYIFLKEWKGWLPEQKIILSIVKEDELTFSFYIYKENRLEFARGTFRNNLNVEELNAFVKDNQNRKFVVLARFPDENNNIIDNPTQNAIVLEGFRYCERNDVKPNSMENNL